MFTVKKFDDRNYIEQERPVAFGWKEWQQRRNQKTRVYVHVENESLLEDLCNRTSRPFNLYKPVVEKALRDKGFEFDKLRWSQKAGCSMCPCSPGFILEGSWGHDVWITLDGDTPKTDASKQDEVEFRKSQFVCEPVQVERTFADLYA